MISALEGSVRDYRQQHWVAVERQLGMLAPSLVTATIPLCHALSTWHAPDAQFRHCLSAAHDFPVLNLPLWLAKDWSGATALESAQLEQAVVALTLLLLATAAEAAPTDPRLALQLAPGVAPALRQAGSQVLAALLPAGSAVAQVYHTCVAPAAGWQHAPLIEVAANLMAELLHRRPEPATWAVLLARLAAAHMLADDLLRIHTDLRTGRLSRGLRLLLEQAGLDSSAPVDPVRALGAIVVTGAAARGIEHVADELRSGRGAAQQLGLPTVCAHLDAVDQQLRRLAEGLSLRGVRIAPTLGFVPSVDELNYALTWAEQYLLRDRTFEEAWEIQRAMSGSQEPLTARLFPVGCVLEILAAAGHAVHDEIDQLARDLISQRVRYYDLLGFIWPDLDDLGLLLRLPRWSSDPDATRALGAQPLQWMVNALPASGVLPVWFPDPEHPGNFYQHWGADCLGVQANGLLGLLAFDDPQLDAVVERAATRLLTDVVRRNGGTQHYVPLYTFWLIAQVLEALAGWREGRLAQQLPPVRAWLAAQIERAAGDDQLSAQDAALLTLTSAALDVPLNRAWLQTMLNMQRYDGSWEAEPVYVTGSARRTAMWYQSRTLSSAVCYAALRAFVQQRGA